MFSQKPWVGKITQPSSFESGSIQACQRWTQENAERCDIATSFFYQKGMGQQTGNKFETSKQFYPIPAFQNGKTKFITKCAPEVRLHVQARPKRHLLLRSFKKGIMATWAVSVGRDILRVPFLCFGLGPAPLKFTNILNVQISLLRALQIRVIIYLDDMSPVLQTLEKLLMSRDTIIFLLTQ